MTDEERAKGIEEVKREFEKFSFNDDTPEDYAEKEIAGWNEIIHKNKLKGKAYTIGFIEVLKEADGKDIAALAEISKDVYKEINNCITFCEDKINSWHSFAAIAKAVTE